MAIRAGKKNQAYVSGRPAYGSDGTDLYVLKVNTSGELSTVTGHDITGIGHGVTTVTTSGTDVVLTTTTPAKKVIIQAQTDNTSGVAVGATGVIAQVSTGNGVLLYAGDAMTLEIDDLADIYIDSIINGEGVRYTYFT